MTKGPQTKYIRWGLTALCVIVLSVAAGVILTNLPGFFDVIRKTIAVFSPLIYGAVFTFLLNPIVNLADKKLLPFLLRRKKMKEKTAKTLSRVLGILLALIVLGALLFCFFALLVPQLYSSIVNIGNNLVTYYRNAEAWVLRISENHPEMRETADAVLGSIYEQMQNWLTDEFPAKAESIMKGLTNAGVAVVREVINILIGLVASIYILFSKSRFLAHTKMLIAAVFHDKTADRLFAIGRKTHETFNGFIMGKLIDSLIIGILCYIGMLILRLPFPVLIATIVGVTNVIPVFGPVIGIVPSAFLILLVNPLQAFYFVIFAVILQQIDGNILGPKILGNTIGISGFWVLISITIAGNLFGFGGMLLGVPVFAILYDVVSERVVRALKRKNRSTESAPYVGLKSVSELDTLPAEEPLPTEETV